MFNEKEYQKNYKAMHKEELKQYRKAYYQKNKEKERQRNKKYNSKHREELKKYYAEHKEQYKERDKKYRQSPHGKYLTYMHMAKHRNRSFKLSEIEFSLLISSPCYYCGELQEHFNGIDRVNNTRGYTTENSVSCCSWCNLMKLTKTKEEFIMKCKQIVEKQEVILSH